VSVHRAATLPAKARLTAGWARVAGSAAEVVGKSLRGAPGYAAIITSVVFAAQVWQPLAWAAATAWLLIIDRKMP